MWFLSAAVAGVWPGADDGAAGCATTAGPPGSVTTGIGCVCGAGRVPTAMPPATTAPMARPAPAPATNSRRVTAGRNRSGSSSGACCSVGAGSLFSATRAFLLACSRFQAPPVWFGYELWRCYSPLVWRSPQTRARSVRGVNNAISQRSRNACGPDTGFYPPGRATGINECRTLVLKRTMKRSWQRLAQ